MGLGRTCNGRFKQSWFVVWSRWARGTYLWAECFEQWRQSWTWNKQNITLNCTPMCWCRERKVHWKGIDFHISKAGQWRCFYSDTARARQSSWCASNCNISSNGSVILCMRLFTMLLWKEPDNWSQIWLHKIHCALVSQWSRMVHWNYY